MFKSFLIASASANLLLAPERACTGVNENTAATLKLSDSNDLSQEDCMAWCNQYMEEFPGPECCQHTKVESDNGDHILYCTLFDSQTTEDMPTQYAQMYGSVIQSHAYAWGENEESATRIAGITALAAIALALY